MKINGRSLEFRVSEFLRFGVLLWYRTVFGVLLWYSTVLLVESMK